MFVFLLSNTFHHFHYLNAYNYLVFFNSCCKHCMVGVIFLVGFFTLLAPTSPLIFFCGFILSTPSIFKTAIIYWKSIGLEIRLHKQVTHTQRYMNNAWSEMVSSHPCLALYSSWSPWLIQTIWDNSSPTMDQPCRLITTLLLLVWHVYDYEQPNAPLPTLSTSRSPPTRASVCVGHSLYPHSIRGSTEN